MNHVKGLINTWWGFYRIIKHASWWEKTFPGIQCSHLLLMELFSYSLLIQLSQVVKTHVSVTSAGEKATNEGWSAERKFEIRFIARPIRLGSICFWSLLKWIFLGEILHDYGRMTSSCRSSLLLASMVTLPSASSGSSLSSIGNNPNFFNFLKIRNHSTHL